MGYSRFDLTMQRHVAWNAGKNVGTKRPLTQKQIWAIRFHLDREGRLRDKALFDFAIDSKLPGCDLVKIKVGDVVAGTDIRNRATVIRRRSIDQCSSNSPPMCERRYWHGWTDGVVQRAIISSQAGPIVPDT